LGRMQARLERPRDADEMEFFQRRIPEMGRILAKFETARPGQAIAMSPDEISCVKASLGTLRKETAAKAEVIRVTGLPDKEGVADELGLLEGLLRRLDATFECIVEATPARAAGAA